jgi:hypothetical protein
MAAHTAACGAGTRTHTPNVNTARRPACCSRTRAPPAWRRRITRPTPRRVTTSSDSLRQRFTLLIGSWHEDREQDDEQVPGMGTAERAREGAPIRHAGPRRDHLPGARARSPASVPALRFSREPRCLSGPRSRLRRQCVDFREQRAGARTSTVHEHRLTAVANGGRASCHPLRQTGRELPVGGQPRSRCAPRAGSRRS